MLVLQTTTHRITTRKLTTRRKYKLAENSFNSVRLAEGLLGKKTSEASSAFNFSSPEEAEVTETFKTHRIFACNSASCYRALHITLKLRITVISLGDPDFERPNSNKAIKFLFAFN